MNVSKQKRYTIELAIFCLTAVILSVIWKVSYFYTAISFAAWALVGHLITIDDDIPGGWSNSDGSIRFQWPELAIKAAALLCLVGLVFFFPALRMLGA